MTGYHLLRDVRQLLGILRADNYLLQNLEHILIHHDEVIEAATHVVALGDGSQIVQQVNALKARLQIVREQLRALKRGETFRAVAALSTQLSSLDGASQIGLRKGLDVLREWLEEFDSVYEDFVVDYSLPATLNVLRTLRELDLSLAAVVDLASAVEASLSPPADIPPGHEELNLFLGSTVEYGSVVRKLVAVDRLYSELCLLLGVSTATYPLQIGKIESGSLWARVFGESRVISLLSSLVQAGAAYLYRNYTHEGKVSAIPRKFEVIETALAFSQKLEGAGIDAAQVRQHIQKASVAVSAELNVLLLGEPAVEVNGVRLSVSEGLEQRYLEQSAALLLRSGDGGEVRNSES